MRSTALTALLLAVSCVGYAQTAPAIAGTIGVFLSFEERPSALAAVAMEREVDSIMRPLGLSLAWNDLNSAATADAFADLIVIHFLGSCEGVAPPSAPGMISGHGPGVSGAALAETKATGAEILHFTDVHCTTLRRYLASEIAGLQAHAQDEIYGRALGRILAHEMYHVFADTAKHGSAGVARESYSRRDLVQPVFTFESREAEMLRAYANRTLDFAAVGASDQAAGDESDTDAVREK